MRQLIIGIVLLSLTACGGAESPSSPMKKAASTPVRLLEPNVNSVKGRWGFDDRTPPNPTFSCSIPVWIRVTGDAGVSVTFDSTVITQTLTPGGRSASFRYDGWQFAKVFFDRPTINNPGDFSTKIVLGWTGPFDYDQTIWYHLSTGENQTFVIHVACTE